MAPAFWRCGFGADVFGAEIIWRHRFGAGTIWRVDVLAPRSFGADLFGAGRFGADRFYASIAASGIINLTRVTP